MAATPRKVLVTGANGNNARQVIAQLRAKDIPVRAVVRDPAKGAPLKALGCEVVTHDLDDARNMAPLFNGIDAAFLTTSMNKNAATQMSNLIHAAKGTGAHIVRLSAIGAAPDAPTDNGRQHYKSDEELKASGLDYTIIRPQFYMDNLAWSAQQIAEEGKIYQGHGAGHLGLIDTRDVADMVAKIIVDRSHVGKTFTPTGPASIGWEKVAKSVSKALGKPVEYVPIPSQAVKAGAIEMGYDNWSGEVFADYAAAYAKGWGDFANDDVRNVTGHAPRSIDAYAKEVLAPMVNVAIQH